MRLCATNESKVRMMRLQRIQCKPFVHAYDLTASPTYIVGCTGRKAVILDRQYNLLQTVEGLDHVYSAHLSPDEKQLLLISNGNKFYVTDIASGTTRKVLIRSPFNNGLEGQGCWSHDGQYIYIPVLHTKGLNSTLRRYRADNLTVAAEFLQDEYWLTNLHPIKQNDAYFMIGLKRDVSRYYFIVMKDEEFCCLPLEEGKGVFFYSYVQNEKQEIYLSSISSYARYSLNGKLLEHIDNPFASGESSYKDMITKYAPSQCGRYIFMSTNTGFSLLDAATKQLLAHVPEEFGVQNFEQLETDVIALATWRGVKLYRMIDE